MIAFFVDVLKSEGIVRVLWRQGLFDCGAVDGFG